MKIRFMCAIKFNWKSFLISSITHIIHFLFFLRLLSTHPQSSLKSNVFERHKVLLEDEDESKKC